MAYTIWYIAGNVIVNTRHCYIDRYIIVYEMATAMWTRWMSEREQVVVRNS